MAHRSRQKGLVLSDLAYFKPLFALNNDGDIAIGQGNHFDDVSHRTQPVQIVGSGFVFVLIKLRYNPNNPVAFVRFFDQSNRFLATHRDGDYHTGEQNRVTDGKYG